MVETNKILGTIFNFWAEDSTKKMLQLFHEWYTAGYLNTDTTADMAELTSEGKVFCFPYALKPGCAESLSTGKVKWGQIETSSTPIRSMRQFPGGFGAAIPAASANPTLALKVLNLAYKDPVFVNMIVYGDEGIDYTKDSNNVVTVNSDTGYNISSYAWEFGNQLLNYITKDTAPDLWDQFKKFNSSAITLDQSGFWFNDSDYASEITALDNVVTGYSSLLEAGSVDVDSTLKKMNADLNNNGLQKVLDAMNAQYQSFLKSK